MSSSKLSKVDVLKIWERRWGELSTHMKSEFLSREILERIIKFEKHQVEYCINIHQRLARVEAELNTRYKSSNRYKKTRGNRKPPPKISKDGKRTCKFCFKFIDSGSICEECLLEQEIKPSRFALGDFKESIRYESQGTLHANWPTEPFFENHNTQRTCPNCESWLDDLGKCECKPDLRWR